MKSYQSTNYTPNINDSRVIDKFNEVVAFAISQLSDDVDKAKQVSRRRLDIVFGFSHHELSKYLRGLVLVCVNEKYKFGINPATKEKQSKCKEYVRNQSGVDYLISCLRKETKFNTDSNMHLSTIATDLESGTTIAVNSVFDKHKEELETGLFSYMDKADRKWNPLQQTKKPIKQAVLAKSGLLYEYDIDTCMPTLILQYAKSFKPRLKASSIDHYIGHKQEVRNRIATDCEISEKTAKEVINALFNGARLHKSIAVKLNYCKAKIQWFREDEFIIQLKKDIAKCWKAIKSGTGTKLTVKAKAGTYRRLERQVNDAVEDFMKQTNNKVFLEHDGWTCENRLCVSEMCEMIKAQTGFEVKLSEEIHENTSFVVMFA
jgi:hypothetical protein